MVRAVLFVLLVLPLFPIHAAAIGPMQDDGGSGRDAGDSFDDPIPVTAAMVMGHLGGPHDPADHYSVQVPAGSLVRISSDVGPYPGLRIALYGPTGSMTDPDHGWAFWGTQALVPDAATWQIVVRPPVTELVTQPTDYTFAVQIEARNITLHETYSGATLLALEAESSIKHGLVQTHMVTRYPNDRPFANHYQTEFVRNGTSFTTFTIHQRTAYGDELLGLQRPNETRDLLHDLEVTGSTYTVVGIASLSVAVALRHTVVSTGPIEKARILVAAGDGDRAATHGSDRTFSVSASDLAEGTGSNPALVTIRDATHEEHVSDRFVGAIDLWQRGSGTATTGNGTVYELKGERQGLIALKGPSGSWRLHVEEMHPDPDYPDVVVFYGASVPDLGIYVDAPGDRFGMILVFFPNIPV